MITMQEKYIVEHDKSVKEVFAELELDPDLFFMYQAEQKQILQQEDKVKGEVYIIPRIKGGC